MKQSSQGITRTCTLAVALTAGFVGSALAQQDGTWTGGGTDNNWLNAANWVTGLVAGNWNSAFFSSGIVNGSVNNNSYQGHNAFTVDGSCATDIAISGIKLPKNEAPITVIGANLTFNADLNAWNNQTFVVAAGKTLTFNGRINQDDNTFSGASVTINGAGTVVMAQSGQYNGATYLNGGTLRSKTVDAVGSGLLCLASGTTWLLGADRQAVAGLNGTGQIRNESGGTVYTGTDGAAQISASKNYVLKLDFDNPGEAAMVNGVYFTAAGLTGTGPAPASVGWSLTGVTLDHAGGGSSGDSGYGLLLKYFYYNGNPGVLTFSNLTVGRIYEAVIFSDPGWGMREEKAIFTNGAESQAMYDTDPGHLGYYAYRFKATAATASIAMYPLNAGNTFHWYGATLEDLTDASPSASIYSATLTAITTGDAQNHRFEGSIDGDIALVKKGPGTQTLFGTNTYSGGTIINGGTLKSVASHATGPGTVSIAPGATWEIWSGANQTIAGLSGAGNITTVADSDSVVSTGAAGASKISAGRNYVQLLDFGNNSGATVNGVTFNSVDNTSGTDWSLNVPNTFYADGGSGYEQLMSDFVYGGSPGVLTFSNLTVGNSYDAVLYTKIGYWPDRWQDATFANGSDVHQLLNTDPGRVGYYSYKFVATDPTATITMSPVNPGNTFHWFAASLEDITSTGIGISTFTGCVTVAVGDAKDHRFAGQIGGAVSLVKQGSGKQTLAGTNTYTGATIITGGTLKLEPPSAGAGAVTIANASFETHDALANDGGTWGYNPTGATWSFNSRTGIAAPGAPWVAGGAAIDGSYAAFVQNNAPLYQSVTIPATGTYQLTFTAANRPGFPASGIDIMIDDVIVHRFTASEFQSGGAFQTFTAVFDMTAGSRRLTFMGVMYGLDSATAIDNIAITSVDVPGGRLPITTSVSIALGSWLDLGGTTQTVSRLYFDGNEKQPGTHGAVGSGATYVHANWFVGTGILNVLNGKYPGMMMMLK